MDFSLPPTHEEFRNQLRRFFAVEAPPVTVSSWDRSESFPMDVYEKMAELGLCGLTFGEEYGGSGGDELAVCVAVEEVARASATLAYAWVPTATFCAKGIARYGTEEQRQALLPEVAKGRMRFAMGLSEPDAGSDLGGLSTHAELRHGRWVINGQKVFTTGADSARYIFCFVRTDPDSRGAHGLSVLLVPTDAEGVTIRPLRKLAGQGTHTCEVFLDNVEVGEDQLVGDVHRGAGIVFGLLDGERIYVGAQGCGVGAGALEIALNHARSRVQFGVPIIQHQAVGHMLADMAIDIETARLLVWRAATKLDAGVPCSLDASMAKVAGSEAGTRCAARGMQILGGYSYMVEYGMERYWRETKLYEIAGGTNQIQRNIIAKHLGAGTAL